MLYYGSITQDANGGIWIVKYPPWQVCIIISASGSLMACEEEIVDVLIVKERRRQEREDSPSLLAFDSQSSKKVAFIDLDTGIDGGKKVNGTQATLSCRYTGITLGYLCISGQCFR